MFHSYNKIHKQDFLVKNSELMCAKARKEV